MSKKKSLFGDNLENPTESQQNRIEAGYVVNGKDLGYFHVSVEEVKFNQKTGKKESKPNNQILTEQEYNLLQKVAKRKGLEVIVLHNPKTDE